MRKTSAGQLRTQIPQPLHKFVSMLSTAINHASEVFVTYLLSYR